MKIPKIKLEENTTWQEYIKENELSFWKMTIDAITLLSENPDTEEQTAFILHGGKLDKDKEFVIRIDEVDETIDRALSKMEHLEEYEMCVNILRLKKRFE